MKYGYEGKQDDEHRNQESSLNLLDNLADKLRSRCFDGATPSTPTVFPNPARQYIYPPVNALTLVNGNRGIATVATAPQPNRSEEKDDRRLDTVDGGDRRPSPVSRRSRPSELCSPASDEALNVDVEGSNVHTSHRSNALALNPLA